MIVAVFAEVEASGSGSPSWAGWRRVINAQPVESLMHVGGGGSATIAVHGGAVLYQPLGGGAPVEFSPVDRRLAIIEVESEQTEALNGTEFKSWLGYCRSTSYDWSSRATTLQCEEPGLRYGSHPLHGWKAYVPGSLGEADPTIEPETANMETEDGDVIGTAINIGGRHWFNVDPESIGGVAWGPISLIDAAIRDTLPDRLSIEMQYSAKAGVDLLLSDPVVYRLRGLTLGGLLGELTRLGCFHQWQYQGTDNDGAASYKIWVYSADEDIAPLPIEPEDPIWAAISSYRESIEPLYDRIEVEGGPIIFGGTIRPGQGWDSSAESAYGDGEGAGDTDAKANHAWARFTLLMDEDRNFRTYDNESFCLRVSFDPETGITSLGGPMSPNLAATAPLRWIPRPSGTGHLATYEATLPPLAFRLAEGDSFCLNFPPDPAWAVPTIEPGTGPWIAVRYPRQDDLSDGPNPLDEWAFSWTELALTIAIDSGQRVRVAIDNPNTDPAADRRPPAVLRLSEPELAMHVMREGSVVGVDDMGVPQTLLDDDIVRDGHPAALAIAEAAAAWAFTRRASAEITFAGYYEPLGIWAAWLTGWHLQRGSVDLGPVVSFARDYRPETASTTITTSPSRRAVTQAAPVAPVQGGHGSPIRAPTTACVGGGGGGDGLFIPAQFVQVDGAQGTSTTAATWRYDIFAIDADPEEDTPILSDYQPATGVNLYRRPAAGQIVPASYGMLYHDGSQWRVAWCNEQLDVEACAL